MVPRGVGKQGTQLLLKKSQKSFVGSFWRRKVCWIERCDLKKWRVLVLQGLPTARDVRTPTLSLACSADDTPDKQKPISEFRINVADIVMCFGGIVPLGSRCSQVRANSQIFDQKVLPNVTSSAPCYEIYVEFNDKTRSINNVKLRRMMWMMWIF